MFTEESIAKAEAVDSFIGSINWQLHKREHAWLMKKFPPTEDYIHGLSYSQNEDAAVVSGLVRLLEALDKLAIEHFEAGTDVFGDD